MTSKAKRKRPAPRATAIVPRVVFQTVVAATVVPTMGAVALGCSISLAAYDAGPFSVVAAPDGGRDGGPDAARDGGRDAGFSVVADGGFSVVAAPDAGLDAGFSVAIPNDAGTDSGFFSVAMLPLDGAFSVIIAPPDGAAES